MNHYTLTVADSIYRALIDHGIDLAENSKEVVRSIIASTLGSWKAPSEPAAPTAQVSRITISRLYNLGNYEHVRYEITMEVQPGGAEKSLRHLEKILHNINPKRPNGVLTDRELLHQRVDLDRAMKMSPQDFHNQYPPPYGAKRVGRIERLAEMKRQLAEQCERSKEWNEQQRLARAALDSIGGTSVYTDAKENWESEL